MKRYTQKGWKESHQITGYLEEDKNGEWVKYKDHLFELVTAVNDSRGICRWKIGYGEVYPACGFKYSFDDEKWWCFEGALGQLKFCPYCGKQIKIIKEGEK